MPIKTPSVSLEGLTCHSQSNGCTDCLVVVVVVGGVGGGIVLV